MKVISVDELIAHQGEADICINSFDAVPLSVINDIKEHIEKLKESYISTVDGMGACIKDSDVVDIYDSCLEIIDKLISSDDKTDTDCTCTDLVDRGAVKEIIDHAAAAFVEVFDRWTLNEVYRLLTNLPSIQPNCISREKAIKCVSFWLHYSEQKQAQSIPL